MADRRLNRYTGRDEIAIVLQRRVDVERRRVRMLSILLALLSGWMILQTLRGMPEVTRYWVRFTVCLVETE